RLRPSQDFTKILNVARTGSSGETYAFNKQGKLLSNSRFDDDLKEMGLLSAQSGSRSALTLDLRDPGVDMTTGARPAMPRSQQPLTRMADDAVNQRPGIDAPGVDVKGYRDYRGVPVLGAWAWLSDLGFGVATEIDADEAFRPVMVLRNAFWTLFGLLSAVALLLLVMTFVARRMETRMREAVIAAGQLGQYALEEKIGEGGMGSVYLGRHAMLRRPTAIKLLEPSKTTEISIARFEREVQHTSQLNHPNTITIYDYGRTNEGVFYYAMEYLSGLSLQSLVERFGAQPDGRVIHIMLQVCGSLIEAHSQRLIHRDIKPANIMLTARGGVRDFVKLLDFGLVKAVDAEKQRTLTAADAITGTPLYLPPESIQDTDRADERSDLYSLGGVAYFLLTGHPVFEAGGVMEIIRKQVEDLPMPPSKRLGHAICPDLEQLVLKCLAKRPQDRPQSASEVVKALRNCVPLVSWNSRDADNWWSSFDSGFASALAPTQTVAFAGTVGHNEVKPAS
ncbi:MAG TPA: serine/threonine-protein kinase, partial [Pirellulales bacterium]